MLYKSINIALACVFLSACQTTQIAEEPTGSSLSPAEAPEPNPVGTVVFGQYNGEDGAIEKISINGSLHSYRSGNGCESTRNEELGLIFAPIVSWENCGGNTGTRNISSKEGNIWPLEVGSKVSFKGSGDSNQSSATWRADTTCEVVDEVRITVVGGTYDTYKVRCSTPWKTETFYYAPSVGHVVLERQRRKRNSNADSFDWEFIRVESPSG